MGDLIDEDQEILEYEDECEDEEDQLMKSMTQERVENILETTFENDSEEETEELYASGVDNDYELKQEAIESLLDFLETTLENDSKEEALLRETDGLSKETDVSEEPIETLELNIVIDKEMLCQLPINRDVVFEPFEAPPATTTLDKIKRWWCELFPSGAFA